jgi:hypothetical protein
MIFQTVSGSGLERANFPFFSCFRDVRSFFLLLSSRSHTAFIRAYVMSFRSSKVYFHFIVLRRVAGRSDSGKKETVKESEKGRENEGLNVRERKETK